MLLRDVMTRNIEEIHSASSLRDAAKRMKALDVGMLPVSDDEQLVGILTDRDIAIRAVAEGHDPNSVRVSDAMTPGIIFCYDDEDIREAARIMEEKQVRRLLVCDRSHRAVGVVSIGDLATRIQDDRLSGEVLERISEPLHPMAG